MSKFRLGDRVMIIGTINAVGDGSIDGFYGVEVAGEGVVGYREESLSPAPPTPTGKTVKVRAAVCVADDGRWVVNGSSWVEDDREAIGDAREYVQDYEGIGRVSMIEADVPAEVEPVPTIPGKVEPSDG